MFVMNARVRINAKIELMHDEAESCINYVHKTNFKDNSISIANKNNQKVNKN